MSRDLIALALACLAVVAAYEVAGAVLSDWLSGKRTPRRVLVSAMLIPVAIGAIAAIVYLFQN